MSEAATAIFCLFIIGCLAPPHWWQAIRNLRTSLRRDFRGRRFADEQECDPVELTTDQLLVLNELDFSTEWKDA